ncbi:MAG: hypothetical protein EOO61_17900 [Hymenobacter sp.]|nr:MAG: hypothetical protein EOO61_17900 [Hymenobacter sp.]
MLIWYWEDIEIGKKTWMRNRYVQGLNALLITPIPDPENAASPFDLNNTAGALLNCFMIMCKNKREKGKGKEKHKGYLQ